MTVGGLLPLFLKVEGRRVLVVGGGRMALTRVKQLASARADVTVVAPAVLPEIVQVAAKVENRSFRPEDLDGAWLAVAAATPQVNGDVAREAEARRIFLNAIDDPDRATAYSAAMVQRGGATIAISTGGRAPALAGLLREAIDSLFPEEVSLWIETAERLRHEWRARGTSMAERRPLLFNALNRLYQPTQSPLVAPEEASP